MGMVFVIFEWKIQVLTLLFIGLSNITVAGIILTANPSNIVEVNQTVTLQCVLDSNPSHPVIVSFTSGPTYTLCTLEPNNGKCKNASDPCLTLYNASCPSETVYSLQVNVPLTWNGISLFCQSLFSGQSNQITFSVYVTVPVTSVTLTRTSITVIAGQEMNLNCTTSYCYPPANIMLYMASIDITSQSKFTTDTYDGLVRTISSTSINVSKSDNGKQVYCTASNIQGREVYSVVNVVTVLFKPEVTSRTPNPYRVLEGQPATLECAVIAANPNTITSWKWFRTESPNDVLHNGSTYTILTIQRDMTGSYSCTASNSVETSVAVTIDVHVLYKPHIIDTPSIIVNESDRAVLTKEIVSNPLSNVSWYNGSELLLTQSSVRTTTLVIEKAVCTDTKNFTLIASNTVERNLSALVELIVNCKPWSCKPNITVGVTDITGIEFSTTVIAYPEPRYELRRENETINNEMMGSITRNAVNNYTIHFNQTVVKQTDFGIYRLLVSNPFGETVVVLNVLPQRKPNKPFIIEVFCEVTRAKVQWISSFNGGIPQSFTVIALNGQHIESQSDTISDEGENEIHSTFIQNLQPSTAYVFYVSAQNSHGISSSENISCTTLKESTDNLPFIAGGSAAGGITLAIVVVVVVVALLRFKKRQNKERNSESNNPVRTNEDALHYTTLAERDVTVERNVYEILTQNEGANQYEACLMKESQETNSQMYESLQKIEITDKRNICDKQMIAKYTKDFSKIYVNHSVTENSAEYINLSFSK